MKMREHCREQKKEISILNLSTEYVWSAFEKLEKDKVKKRRVEFLLADIISLVRFGLEKENILTPYQDTVELRFADWLVNQEKAGNTYTDEQMEWITMIKDHIAPSLEITIDDFDNVPFYKRGGAHLSFDCRSGLREGSQICGVAKDTGFRSSEAYVLN